MSYITKYEAFDSAILQDAIKSGWNPKAGSWGDWTAKIVMHNKKFGITKAVFTLPVANGVIYHFVTVNQDNQITEASCFAPS